MSPSSSTVSGILAPVPTPFGGDGGFDAGAFRDNLQRWMATPLSGVLVLGSNGEAPLLTEAESDAVVQAARQAVPSDRWLLVGTGRPSTAATLAATRRAFDAGADAALVVTPSYYRDSMDGQALRRHYLAVADAGGGPVLLYHVPAFTGVDFPVAVALDLSAHPGIIGMKDSSGEVERIGALAAAAPDDFAVLVGNAPILAPALDQGAAGGILAAACVAPEACCELWDQMKAGRVDEARRLQERLTPLARAVTIEHGIPGLKALLDEQGFRGGAVRPPLTDLDTPGRRQLLSTWQAFRAEVCA
jgi:4-hydroxy-2-oxoglutarate aldolase